MTRSKFSFVLILLFSATYLTAGCSNTKSDEDSPATIDNTSTAEGPHNRATHSGLPDEAAHFSDDIYKNMQILTEEMQAELGAYGPLYEKRYLDLMISHMNGEVAISRDVLNSGASDSLKAMAREILRSRDHDFARMQQMRKTFKK